MELEYLILAMGVVDLMASYIADQAEYTPCNVQTKEERQTIVYAVKLAVNNPDGKLKPGMPVDLIFEEKESSE